MPIFPSPALADLDAAQLAFTTAMADAKNVDRLKVRIKNDSKRKVRAVLSSLAYYVESVAQGNAAILFSSGFKISKGKAATTSVNAIEGFKVAHGNNSGQMKLSCIRIKRVHIYSFFFGIDDGDNTIYDHVTKTRVRTTISGLKAGKTYSFYMEAIGPNEKSVKSEIIRKIVS